MIGTSLIEEGKSFDLRKALNELLIDAGKMVRKWKRLMFLSYIAEIITFIIMIIMRMVGCKQQLLMVFLQQTMM